jgi:hypothetical protein
VHSLEGVVEREFVKPMHFGATIVAYRARTPGLAVIPYIDGQLIDGANERLDEFPGLAAWWREAEDTWEAKKTEANQLTLRQQIDYQSKLRKQFPIAAHRVVYTKSGQHLAACRVDDPVATIDHTLYWGAVGSVEEGRYLCAVLNSQVLADAVVGLQARGQHNPRHFDLNVFALGFPEFDASNSAHERLVKLARRAEEVAAAVPLTSEGQFQQARRTIRGVLKADGVAAEIDLAVDGLLADAAVPDLMDVLSQAANAARGSASSHERKSPTPIEPRINL